MREVTTDGAELGEVARGIAWAIEDLPGGRIEDGRIVTRGGSVRLHEDERYAGTDGYSVSGKYPDIAVRAGGAFGFVSALTNLAYRINHGFKTTHEIVPRFKSRFYSMEANLGEPSHAHTHIADLDERFWVDYFKMLSSRHFNGFIFFGPYHPFEYFLDYDEYREAGAHTRHKRADTRAGLKRAMKIARAFGIKTFLQHYATHFPAGLARAHDFGLDNQAGRARLAAISHQVVNDYSRYVYRRTLQLLPELTGFYVNFLSWSNSGEFIRQCVYPEAVLARPMPEFIFSLWGFTRSGEAASLVREYPGKIRIAHTISEHAHTYFWPAADRRIGEWKAALPDTEYVATLGPDRYGAAGQRSGPWSDGDFVERLLADAEKKGADSIAFQTERELLCCDIDGARLASQEEIDMAALNRGHLAAAINYVRGSRAGRSRGIALAGRRMGVAPANAVKAMEALREASQISLLTYQQFFCQSHYEGYTRPLAANFYADPYLHPPMTFLDDEARGARDVYSIWLSTRIKTPNVAQDVQAVIDYVNPAKRRARRHPAAMARLLEKHAEAARALAREAGGRRPEGPMAALASGVEALYHWGMRVHHEVGVAIGLYGAFFPRSKRQVVAGLRRAVTALSAAQRHMRANVAGSARIIPFLEDAHPEEDLKALKRLVGRVEGRGYPFAAFAAYCRSLHAHNEIRGVIRPYKDVRAAETRFARQRLRASAGQAREAIGLLSSQRHAALRGNVEEWLEYVETQQKGLDPPSYEVRGAGSLGEDEGFVQLQHDQCFRLGECTIADLNGFFEERDFQRRGLIFFRVARSEKGLVLSVRERDVDVVALQRRWREYEGSFSDSCFLRMWLDRAREEKQVDCYSINAMGRRMFRTTHRFAGEDEYSVDLRRYIEGGRGEFRWGDDWWRLDYTIAWDALGGAPRAGERWSANVATSTAITRNTQSIWCAGYEFVAGKFGRMGTFVFE